MAEKLRITLVRSSSGRPSKQREILRSLGLSRINQTVVHGNTPTIRGMVKKIIHLLAVEEV